MAAESCWRCATSGLRTAMRARTTSPLASASAAPTWLVGARGGGVSGRRVQRPEAMAVRAKQVGEDEGIPRVTLGARRGVTRTTGLEGVGVDGHDLEAGVEQRVDEQPRGAFEGNAEGTTPA